MTFKKYLLLLFCLPCFVQAKNITISRLTCEMQEGLVLVEAYPRLGWTMESPENGTRQTAYEIEIREACTGRMVWNTGKVQSSQSQLIPTHGAKLLRFSFYNYNAHEMMDTIDYALHTFYDCPEAWDAMVQRAMAEKLDWDASAEQYIRLFASLL